MVQVFIFMNITIIGLGVIGGSLGLAIKQNHPRISVTGYDRPGTIVKALRRGAIDLGASTIPSAVHDADIVFLCTPVSSIIDLLPSVALNVKPNGFFGERFTWICPARSVFINFPIVALLTT